jgi:HAE1 family hydrophobic/amphiphilic exporter-1
VQASVGGSRAGYYREGGEQFPITVRLRPEDRLTAQDLSGISVRTPEGGMVPLSALASRVDDRGPTEIEHIDGQRVMYITADLEAGVALGDAVAGIREQLRDLQLPREFSIVFGGAYREQQEAQRDFIIAIALALALVYMVMAGQFERFLDPLIVMFSVPVAIVGVVPALLITGTTVNVQSVMGMVMLVGIVVNNAIILIDYMNQLRREHGYGVADAVITGGTRRLRPVLMTTVTTVLGLVPMAMGVGEGAELQAPMARVVIGGLLSSTVITLVLIPIIYGLVEGRKTREQVGTGEPQYGNVPQLQAGD